MLASAYDAILKDLNYHSRMHNLMFVFYLVIFISIESHFLSPNDLNCQLLSWVALIELCIYSARYHLPRHKIISICDDL